MPAPHHLLIPYAASRAPGAQEALKGLALPHLDRLLARLSTADASPGEETSLTPPHERALAQALGLGTQDGLVPWAAWHRLQQGQPTGEPPSNAAWAFITPCQWQVTTDHITLHDPAHLGLDEAASRELLAIVAPWFAEDGITLHYDQPTRWLASSPLFATLATASLERVQGRDVRAWMPDARKARTLHRLQSEMQMLLYTHPWNDAREAQGLPPVNAFWVHGAGRLDTPPPSTATVPQVDARLQDAALRGDWPAWAQAWQTLDTTALAALHQQATQGHGVRLTLCGERGALTWQQAPRSLLQKIMSIFRPQRFADVREQL